MNSVLPTELATLDLDPLRSARLQQRAHSLLARRRIKRARTIRRVRRIYDLVFEPALAAGLCAAVMIWTVSNLAPMLGP